MIRGRDIIFHDDDAGVSEADDDASMVQGIGKCPRHGVIGALFRRMRWQRVKGKHLRMDMPR